MNIIFLSILYIYIFYIKIIQTNASSRNCRFNNNITESINILKYYFSRDNILLSKTIIPIDNSYSFIDIFFEKQSLKFIHLNNNCNFSFKLNNYYEVSKLIYVDNTHLRIYFTQNELNPSNYELSLYLEKNKILNLGNFTVIYGKFNIFLSTIYQKDNSNIIIFKPSISYLPNTLNIKDYICYINETFFVQANLNKSNNDYYYCHFLHNITLFMRNNTILIMALMQYNGLNYYNFLSKFNFTYFHISNTKNIYTYNLPNYSNNYLNITKFSNYVDYKVLNISTNISKCTKNDKIASILFNLNSLITSFKSKYTFTEKQLEVMEKIIFIYRSNPEISFEFSSITLDDNEYIYILNENQIEKCEISQLNNKYIAQCNLTNLVFYLKNYPFVNKVCLYFGYNIIINRIYSKLDCQKFYLISFSDFLIKKFTNSNSQINFSFNNNSLLTQYFLNSSNIYYNLLCLFKSKDNEFNSSINYNTSNYLYYCSSTNEKNINYIVYFIAIISKEYTINYFQSYLGSFKNEIELSFKVSFSTTMNCIISNAHIGQKIILTMLSSNTFTEDLVTACLLETEINSYLIKTNFISSSQLECSINFPLNQVYDRIINVKYVYNYDRNINNFHNIYSASNNPIYFCNIPIILSQKIIIDYSKDYFYLDIDNVDNIDLSIFTDIYFIINKFNIFSCIYNESQIKCETNRHLIYHLIFHLNNFSHRNLRIEIVIKPILYYIPLDQNKYPLYIIGPILIKVENFNTLTNYDDNSENIYYFYPNLLLENLFLIYSDLYLFFYIENNSNLSYKIYYNSKKSQYYFKIDSMSTINENIFPNNELYVKLYYYIYYKSLNDNKSILPFKSMKSVIFINLASTILENKSDYKNLQSSERFIQLFKITNLYLNSNIKYIFVLKHVTNQNFIYYSQNYQCFITSSNNIFNCYIQFSSSKISSIFYIGEYCVGISLLNDINRVKYFCSSSNNIKIFSPIITDDDNLKDETSLTATCNSFYQIISIFPNVTFKDSYINIYYYSNNNEYNKINFQFEDNTLLDNCEYSISNNNTFYKCLISSSLNIDYGFHTITIINDLTERKLLSNSFSFILIKKVSITEINPSITFPTNYYSYNDDNYIKLTLNESFIPSSKKYSNFNFKIKCRFLIYSISSIIKLPFYNDTKGIILDDTNILCSKGNNFLNGDAICIQISMNNFFNYISSCDTSTLSMNIKNFVSINKFSPIYLVKFNNSISTILTIYTSDISLFFNTDILCLIRNNNNYYKIIKSTIVDSNTITCEISNSFILKNSEYLIINLVINNIIQIQKEEKKILYKEPFFINEVYPREFTSKGEIYINILGLNFDSLLTYKCKFSFEDDLSTIMTTDVMLISSNYIKCKTPDTSSLNFPSSSPQYINGFLSLEISENINPIIPHYNNLYQIKTYIQIEIIHSSPSYVYLHHKFGLIITGKNFLNVASLVSKFTYEKNSILIKPIFINSETLFIYSPTSFDFIKYSESTNIPFKIYLSISNNNFEFSNTFDIILYPYPQVTEISPVIGYHSGETILITGNYFNENINYCLFGDDENKKTISNYISETSIKCPIPYYENFKMKDMKIPFNLMIYDTTNSIYEIFPIKNIYFTYLHLIRIKDLIPSHGMIIGGTEVIIKLDSNDEIPTSIFTSSLFTVKFCDVEVDSTSIKYINSTTFSVLSPTMTTNIDCNVLIIYNGKQINLSQNIFHYLDYSLSNIRIKPTCGPYTGDTLITIYNDEIFNPDTLYKCLFINLNDDNDYVSIPAYVVDEYHITCLTEIHEIGEFKFSLEIDNHYLTYNLFPIIFTFYAQIHIININPLYISSSISCGIEFNVQNFILSENSVVKFGQNIIDYNSISGSNDIYMINIPNNFSPGDYPIFISNNGQNFIEYKISHLKVISSTHLKISKIYPEYIPLNTKGIVYVYGEDFETSYNLYGPILVNIFEINYIVECKYINDTTLSFDYPHEISISSIYYPISSYVIFGYNRCFIFPFHPIIHLYKKLTNIDFNPKFYQEYSEVAIVVTADNLYNFPTLKCIINNIEITAYYLNINSFGCILPPLPAGNYIISFSNNGVDMAQTNDNEYDEIYVIPKMKIFGVNPNVISNFYSGYVFIYGDKFINGIVNEDAITQEQIDKMIICEWRRYLGIGKNVIHTNGIFLRTNLIKCNIPSTTTNSFFNEYNYNSYDNIYYIRIGYNVYLKDYPIIFSSEYAIIYIYQYPPNGMYINIENNGEIIKCNRGYSCSRDYSSYKNINKFPCNNGYHMPYYGRQGCIPCPKNGFECSNNSGPNMRIDSNICEAGFVCSKFGTKKEECPPGHFCKNTKFNNYLIYPLSKYLVNKPAKCPLGTYCIGGVSDFKLIKDSYNTPQLCILGHLCLKGSKTPLGIGDCLSGHYCPDMTKSPIPCPMRTYCPGRGNIKFILCEPGTYNDKIGMSKCQICPIGYICPNSGMLKPEPCPNGYYCAKKGLTYPFQYCKAGNVCYKGMKFNFNNRFCFYSRVCETTYGFYILESLSSSAKLASVLGYDVNFHTYLCCYNYASWYELLQNFDNSLLIIKGKENNNYQEPYSSELYYSLASILKEKYTFLKYYSQFTSHSLTGYDFAIDYVENASIESTLFKASIYIPFHKNIFTFITESMFSSTYSFYPTLCPRKYYCLEGVATEKTSISTWSYIPKLCLTGYYCAGGAKYQSGTGVCPTGYYCAAGTDIPSIGHTSTDDDDESIVTGCYPGTFITSESTNNNCLDCPDGYECIDQGTYWPTICQEGFFRSIFESCVSCPKGTFSYEKGLKDSSQCIICPEGKLCKSTGTNNPENIKNCDEGTICYEGSGLITTITCINGYYCPTGMKPNDMVTYTCPMGYMCGDGTGETDKYGMKCPVNYYCPEGSGYTIADSSLDEDEDDYSNLRMCPYGTSSEGNQGLVSILQCFSNSDYLLYTSSLRRLDLSDTSEYNNLDEMDYDSDLFLYYEDLNNYDLISLELMKFSTTSTIDSSYNSNRKSILSFSPLINDGNVTIVKEEMLTFSEITSFIQFPKYYYLIPENSYALVTFDFRHLTNISTNNLFIYGIDWDISFEKYFSLTGKGIKLEIPEPFLNKTNKKETIHEFIVYTLEEIYLSININIYNGIYSTYFSFFNNSATIINVKPHRAELETNKFFGIVLTRENSDQIALPVNLPLMNASLESQYSDITKKISMNYISYNTLDQNEDLIKNSIEDGINSYTLYSTYWGDDEKMGITYIPYISNCKGYGKYLNLWSLLEQNKQCNLTKEEDTIYISDFSFGVKANGDSCDISLDCIFDEDVNKPSNKKYWYQLTQEDVLFQISQIPINLQQLLSDLDSFETVNVPIETEISNGEIPGTIVLEINYFQISKTLKKIIDAKLIYKDAIDNRIVSTNSTLRYNFQIKYYPYTHTKLMIAFALSSKFYLVLYIIEGSITTLMVTIFYLYHKLMSRVYPRPIFKFFTFFPLILPPVIIGWIISSIPLLFILIFADVITIGKIFFKEKHIFSYKKKNITYSSIFDFFIYFQDESIDLKQLRMGRLGTMYICLGIILIIYHTHLVIPDVKLKRKRSYDNNRWDFIFWKRFTVYYVDFLLTAINIYFVFLSFSKTWSKYIWYFTYCYKIIGIIAENWFESVFREQLLISGFGIIFNVIQNMITFGAEDLIDFLNSSFIEQGGTLVEKVYVEAFTNYLRDHWEDYKNKIIKYIRMLLKYDLELESEKKVEDNEEEKENDTILLSDENEEEENENDNNSFKSDNSNSDNDNDNDEEKTEKESQLSASKVNALEVEEYFDRYKGFASDLLSYFYNITFYLVLWVHYDETQIFSNYGISKENFIYFYYFTILSVCFTVCNDIIMHNLLEEYSNIQMHDFLDYCRYRYYVRPTNWCLDDPTINFCIEFDVRKMYKLCFSSQYYYLKSVYMSGLCFVTIGITTVIVNKINPFADFATIFIFIVAFIICYVVYKITSFIFHVLKIWHIYEEKKNDADIMNVKSNTIKTIVRKNAIPPIPISEENWNKVKYLIEQKKLITENLRTEKLIMDITRKQFVNNNRKWLQDVIGEILTPKTIILNKKKIIKVLMKKYKDTIQADIDLESMRFYSKHNTIDSKDSYESKEFREDYLVKFNKNKMYKEILIIWKKRAQLFIKLMNIVKLIINDMKKNKCEICGNFSFLKSVYKGNLINLFFDFLQEKNQTVENFDVLDFKIYFKDNGKKDIITLCSNCI